MVYEVYRKLLQDKLNEMMSDEERLYVVNADKDEMWDIYLNSFPEKYNPIYRERRVHDCQCCRSFIRHYANVVAIKDNKIVSIWDIEMEDEEFADSVKNMSEYIHSKEIQDVFVHGVELLGVPEIFEVKDNETKKWEHLSVTLDKEFSYKGNKTIDTVKSDYRGIVGVFGRAMKEITQDSIETVIELIAQNSLYRGKEQEKPLEIFMKSKKEYLELPDDEKDCYVWKKALDLPVSIAKMRNTSMGTLLVDIAEDVDLEIAVQKYEAIMAPENYKRPQAIFTKKMLEQAKEKLSDLVYLDSLGRRYAELSDITVQNVLFSNKDSVKVMSGDIFEEMEQSLPTNVKSFGKVEEIGIEDFISNVLPTAEEVELFLENKFNKNMVSLVAPKISDSKTMFKWDNNFSWAYTGNIADSSVRENVKKAGGNVQGEVRFSIQWNDIDTGCEKYNDLDAHCKITGREGQNGHIYHGKKKDVRTGGRLDIDIQEPMSNVAVENIYWTNTNLMKEEDEFVFSVNNYSGTNVNGFRAELEVNGEVLNFDYADSVRDSVRGNVNVVKIKRLPEWSEKKFEVTEMVQSNSSSREIWNVKTGNFVPVYVVMNSPNYWDGQQGVGNKHYFFMLKNCINPESPNGFFNEHLDNELMEHKRVLEAMGSKLSVDDSSEQLSGVGFSDTRRNEFFVQVKSKNIVRKLKVKV